MDEIDGFHLQNRIHQTSRTATYRGKVKKTGREALIRILQIHTHAPSVLARFHQHLQAVQSISIPGILAVHEIVTGDNTVALVLEDFPGTPLKEQLRSKRLPLAESLAIAISLSETIGQLHRHRIVHMGINPDNIFLSNTDGSVRLTGFGIEQEVTHENDEIAKPATVSRSLAYMSPEQTGRMNRSVEYGTDLYSLGVVLYEMLTGKCPFTTTDPLMMLHSHMARSPVPPSVSNPEIPRILSDITMKLLAKASEDRYQSGFGLKVDLEKCWHHLQSNSQFEDFPLAQADIAPRFSISGSMIGRDREIDLLLAAFERVSKGESEVVLVSGQPGIGKSALIQEIHKPITAARGYFITGKFEKIKQNEPYSAIYQAFTQLARQLLAEPADAVDQWRSNLMTALGSNGRLIVDVIPEMEMIIGKQEPVPPLQPEESQNRFLKTWKDFIAVFATRAHPLVIFLDDLQWADRSSIAFVHHMATGNKIPFLMWIGAFRDPDEEGRALLAELPSSLQQDGGIVTRLALSPLDPDKVNCLLAEILRCEPGPSHDLAVLVHEQTGGNPFFINQFLKTLHDNGSIRLDTRGEWEWDTGAIQKLGITDNVVTLLTAKIDRFGDRIRETLKICACMGLRFTPETIAVVRKADLAEVMSDLSEVMASGLIAHADETYFFTHDRIQETAYSLSTETERLHQHYRIGRHILENTEKEDRYNKIFYIVDQLNNGRALIRSESEKRELLELNRQAGKKAKDAAAFEAARNYFRQAMSCLPESPWKAEYETTLEVHKELAVCEHLCRNFSEAESFFDECLQNAKTNLDKASVHNLKLILLANLTRFQEALDTARTGLRLLGSEMPSNPGRLSIVTSMLKIRLLLKGRKAQDLVDLPEMKDPTALLTAKILMNSTMTAYFIDANLSIVVALKMFELTIKHGNSSVSPYAYAVYGVVLGAGFGDYKNGSRFGEVARKLNQRYRNPELKGKIDLLFGGGICIWTAHLKEGLFHLQTAKSSSLDHGDVNSAIYAMQAILILMITGGYPLEEVSEALASNFDFIARSRDPGALNYFLSVRQFIHCLQQENGGPATFSDEHFDETNHVRKMKADNIPVILHRHYLLKMRLFFIMGNMEAALKAGVESEKLIDYSMGQIVVPEHYFFFALTNATLAASAGKFKKRKLLKRASRCLRKLKKWAFYAPDNFLHKQLLVEAEIARHSAGSEATLSLFGRAVKAARESGYVQNEAIACERAADYYFSLGLDDPAAAMVRQAHAGFRRWGAHAKVVALEKRFPQILTGRYLDRGESEDAVSTLLSKIDIRALRIALKATAEETIHSRLLSRTMRTVIETAGAQKGLLLLRKGPDRMAVEAEGYADTETIAILQSTPVEASENLSHMVVNFVHRTGESIVIQDASRKSGQLPQLASDPYIVDNAIQSILCMPITIGSGPDTELVGLLYLENNRTADAFTEEIIEMLDIICMAVAGRIELSRKAVTDGLTGLYNHEYFQSVLRHEVLLSKRQDHHLSLIMIDIDHFKHFNDSWGHQMGDRVLQLVSSTIRNTCRQSDIIARYGGEEIAIILRETKIDTAMSLGEKLRSTIQHIAIDPVEENKEPLHVTASLGIAAFPTHASEHEGLIRKADEALYASKNSGRNRVSVAGIGIE